MDNPVSGVERTVEVTVESFSATVKRQGIVLLDWWASWCGPCRAFAPIYSKVAARHPDVVFGKVNTDVEGALAAAFGIRSIPTLMMFRDGILLFAQPGMLPEQALEDLVARGREVDMNEVHKMIAQAAEGHELPTDPT